jgi:hypothetical protein
MTEVASTSQVAGRKRPHPEQNDDCHIPSVVTNFDPVGEDLEVLVDLVADLTTGLSPFQNGKFIFCKVTC